MGKTSSKLDLSTTRDKTKLFDEAECASVQKDSKIK